MAVAQGTWLLFQRDVAELFRLSGFTATTDVLVGHKKADVLLTERRLGKISRIAVECKDWGSTLTQSQVTQIYANYLPLIPEHVDEVLVVTRVAIADSAKAMIARTPQLRAVTFSEIHASIMDFSSYLQTMVDQFCEDGLDRYYIPPESSDGESLSRLVEDWLKEDTDQPLALLGGYGIGKTTFARRLVHDLALKAQKDSDCRIPLLVRLGEISNEQSLEGLLGKLLTATNLVRNYTFSAFLKLNQLGRFLVVLDGFDEMKQSITWTDFRYNFAQINRLVGGAAKVIVLGRPTAFLTDSEQNFALHGIRSLGGREVKDPGLPDYREIPVGGFSTDQIEEFLPRYLSYLADNARSPEERSRYQDFQYDLSDLRKGSLADIVKRPVQLKMLTEILPDYQGKNLGTLTAHELYDYFIDYVIERETSKPDRARFNPAERRAFARDIALWLWKGRRELSTTIPLEIVGRYRAPGEDLETLTRDLVVGSLLDRRVGQSFFFPHRSFQEFLVAEAIHQGVMSKTLDFSELPNLLTPEVYEFLQGFVDRKFVAAAAPQLEAHRGPIPLSLIRCMLVADDPLQYFSHGSVWGILVGAFGVKYGVIDPGRYRQRLREFQNTTKEPRLHIISLFAALIASTHWKNAADDEPSSLVTGVISAAMRFASSRYADKKRDASEEGFSANNLLELLKGLNYAERRERGDLHVSSAYRHIHAACKNAYGVSDWDDGSQIDYRRAGLPERLTDYKQIGRFERAQLFELMQRARRLKRKSSEEVKHRMKDVQVVTRKSKRRR